MIPSFLARLAAAGLLISNVLADSEFDWETVSRTQNLGVSLTLD
jgi:hypothetical protein